MRLQLQDVVVPFAFFCANYPQLMGRFAGTKPCQLPLQCIRVLHLHYAAWCTQSKQHHTCVLRNSVLHIHFYVPVPAPVSRVCGSSVNVLNHTHMVLLCKPQHLLIASVFSVRVPS